MQLVNGRARIRTQVKFTKATVPFRKQERRKVKRVYT